MSWFTLKKRLQAKKTPVPLNMRDEQQTEPEDDSISTAIKTAQKSSDFTLEQLSTPIKSLSFSFYKTLIDDKVLNEVLLKELQQTEFTTLQDLKQFLSFDGVKMTTSGHEALQALLQGAVLIRLSEQDEICLIVPLLGEIIREVGVPEIEFTVIGPKEAFVESIDVNIHLVRKRLPIPELHINERMVGELTKTKVSIIYIDSIANEENINTMFQRISDIEIDQVIDSSVLSQLIGDKPSSPFPTFVETERPDRVVASLCEGKVAVLVDGSPQAIIGPSTLIEFFSALEDYFIGWQISSAIRIMRLFAVWFSVFATSLYVAFLTYHVELIPEDLLETLIMSRSIIPFPPILEVLFLELTIELLREAGARLPTKVGQTIGIVGGIVIGTAAVEAGLTSNVLLIIVALTALASFTTPVYRMGNTIRYIRFPFIFAAEAWGVISITILFCLLLIHLLSLTSLGRPYLEPLYPLRLADLKDSVIRMPLRYHYSRPLFLQTKNSKRFSKEKAMEKKDIDEDMDIP